MIKILFGKNKTDSAYALLMIGQSLSKMSYYSINVT